MNHGANELSATSNGGNDNTNGNGNGDGGNGNGDGSIPAGDIRFYDNYEPPLDAGDYVISVQQRVRSRAGEPDLDRTFPAAVPAGTQPVPLTQKFSVVAPRFALDPSDVHSSFPPDSSSGAFEQNLPHVLLNKRALPWERYLVEGNKATPWLALLLLSPEEIIAPADPGTPTNNTPTNSTLANPTRTGTYRSSQLLQPPPGTLGPNLVAESQDLLDQVTAIALTGGGSGYTSAPQVNISGGGASANANATAEVNGDGQVISIKLTSGGSGYTSTPQVTFTGGGGTGATATALRGVLCRAIDISTETFTKVTPRYVPGANESAPPSVDELKFLAHCRQVNPADKEITSQKDRDWFSVVIGNRFPSPGAGPVLSLTLEEGGLNYTSAPAVVLSGGGGSGAAAIALINDDGAVSGLRLTAGGSDYTSAPQVTFTGGGGAGAKASTQIGAPWIAHLVSLEGFENYLTDAPVWKDPRTGAEVQRVRLASLHSWSFTCVSEAGDFRDLVTNLIAGQAVGGGGLLLRLPVTPEKQPDGSATAKAQQALSSGYAALGYETLVGDETFAWYRGPLLPGPKPRFTGGQLYKSAAAAMIYDEDNALFDESYAAAWQTGRLLALSDGSFGVKLMQWRRESHRVVNLLVERTNPARLLSPQAEAFSGASPYLHLAAPDSGPQNSDASNASAETSGATNDNAGADNSGTVAQLRELLADDHVSRSFMDYFLTDFSEEVAPKVSSVPAPQPSPKSDVAVNAPPGASATRLDQVRAIRGLLGHPAVRQLLVEDSNANSQADADSPLAYVVNWLARLCLLYYVPFVNLVPDARMLPRESLRLFSVDPNYLDALASGALSAGVQSSRDTQLQALVGPAVLAQVGDALRGVRYELEGVAPPLSDTGTTPGTPPSATMTGLLLRSTLVSGWPGLEVRAYQTQDQSQPLKLARMDRLAPDVLLCLFPVAPARVEISEPKEGLAFGHEDDSKVDLRWVTNDGGSIGSIIGGSSVTLAPAHFRAGDASAPVLNVQSWQAYLQAQLNAAYVAKGKSAPAGWGPAAFAIQMVRAPEELVLLGASASLKEA